MGFPGHGAVGILMVFLSLAGLLKDLSQYLRCKIQEKKSNGTVSVPCYRNLPAIPLFMLVIFVFVFGLALGSTYARFTDPTDGRFTAEAVINLQHASMFGPFIILSMVKLIIWKGWYVPRGVDDVITAISLSWGAFIITSEQNQAEYADLIHKLPANLLYLTAVMCLLEFVTAYTSRVVSILKGYFLLCFGTWYIQSNYIPYRNMYLGEVPDPEWNHVDETIIGELILSLFGCHLILGQVIIGLLYSLLHSSYSRCEGNLHSSYSRREGDAAAEADHHTEIILYER
ncbi:transmembrane protein 45B-like [Argopecten irradians]|uniref:transmembrane protein 45B-like n=1 Tax=Argopecten irradians TaxID=31199 RepID=UPI003722884A